MRKWRNGLALGLAVTGVALGVAAGPAAATQAEYDQGLALGTEAYKYGLPLVTTDKTYRNQTSVDVSNGDGFGPPNQFNPVRQLTDPTDRSVVAPNYDTLYSIAWLNLKQQPQIIHVPKVKDRYFVIPLMSPYTEDFKNLGTVNGTKPGDYAVVGPDQKNVKLPKGVKRIKSKYNRAWIIQRTYIDYTDPKDFKRVHKIQNEITLTPLNKYGKKGWKPKTPKNPDTTVNTPAMPTGLTFFDKLGKQLAKFPPPAEDQAELDKFAPIGVGPGLEPSENPNLSPDTIRGMTDAVTNGPTSVRNDLRAMYLAGFAAHNGSLVTPTGNYGTDYSRRAIVTTVGLGALVPTEAIYPFALTDHSLAPLTGTKKYVMHIPAGQLPPVDGFWSVTLYDNDGFMVPNPIDRFVINDRTDLAENADGSIDIYLQSTEPTDPKQAQNWLPTPAGANYRLIWRLYDAGDQVDGILSGAGWSPPAINVAP